MMDKKLFVAEWFKLPPEKDLKKNYNIQVVPSGTGKKRANHAKPCKKIKKQTSKKGG